MLKSDCFCVGRITRKHGYKGELKFVLEKKLPPELKKLESVFLERQGKLVPFLLEQYTVDSNGNGRLKLEGVDSDTDALLYLRSKFYLPKDWFPEEDEEFLFEELVGFTFEDETSRKKGIVISTIEGKQQDLIEVEIRENRFFVPFVDEFILMIDFDKKIIQFALPEGLFDL